MIVLLVMFIGWGICLGYALNDAEEWPWWGSIVLVFAWPVHIGMIIYEMTHKEETE